MLVRRSIALLLACFVCFTASQLCAQDNDDKPSAEVSSAAEVDGAAAESATEPDAADSHADSDDHPSEDGAGHTEAGHSSGADHGDTHHDTDPTHGNMSDPALSLVEFRADMALFSAVVFLLLLAGLIAFAWKPIMEGLTKREERISGNIRKAEQDAASAAAKLAEYESKLASAAEEAQEIVAEARKAAEVTGQKLVAAAQEDAARLKERATAEIESAKRVALNEVAGQSTGLAMSLAKQIVGREVNSNDHNAMIQEMLSKLPSDN